jgi:hypothetical protein
VTQRVKVAGVDGVLGTVALVRAPSAKQGASARVLLELQPRSARPPAPARHQTAGLRGVARPLLDELEIVGDLWVKSVPDAKQTFDFESGGMREHLLPRVDLEHAPSAPLGNALAATQESDQVVTDHLLAEQNPHLPYAL